MSREKPENPYSKLDGDILAMKADLAKVFGEGQQSMIDAGWRPVLSEEWMMGQLHHFYSSIDEAIHDLREAMIRDDD